MATVKGMTKEGRLVDLNQPGALYRICSVDRMEEDVTRGVKASYERGMTGQNESASRKK